eukprot:5761211-Ditylum_brightwellii.AAC.1
MTNLIRQNKLHLHQAFDTPFASSPMKECIGENGTGQGAKEILEGKFNPNKFNNLPAVNYWIKHHLRRVATPNSVPISLTVDELKSLLKRQCKQEVRCHLDDTTDITRCYWKMRRCSRRT